MLLFYSNIHSLSVLISFVIEALANTNVFCYSGHDIKNMHVSLKFINITSIYSLLISFTRHILSVVYLIINSPISYCLS